MRNQLRYIMRDDININIIKNVYKNLTQIYS